ncbi:MAG TPA: response regulator [Herpetosiphonaceae bacterium]
MSHPASFGASQQTILIIDDNTTNLKVAMEYLQAYSFEILTARNGSSGIERAQLAQPDLIVLDVEMPGIDGFETCRRLKANPRTAEIPVIFMTVLNEPAAKVRGLEAGAVDFVSKPIDAPELLARVTTHLKLRALQEHLRQANTQLDERIRERTAELEAEIARRVKSEQEREGLLELVRQQSDQLRQLSQLLLETQTSDHRTLQIDLELLDRELTILEGQLAEARQLGEHETAAPGALRALRPLLGALQQAQATLAAVRLHTSQATSHLDQASSHQRQLRDNPLINLSDREYEVFQLLVQGRSNAEIAEVLVLAKTTVSTHQRRIMEKLGISDIPGLIKFAMRHRLTA